VLPPELASQLARVALSNIGREYPRRIDHLAGAAEDELQPRRQHPAFYGSYDWHSAVHMHWLLARVLRLYPVSREAPPIADALDEHLSAEALQQELAYFRSPAGASFERPYGWAWLLELQAEALAAKLRWGRALAPLADELAGRMSRYLDHSPYPVRAGSHANSAFACVLALDYARAAADTALEFSIRKAARRWYGADREAPLRYEPSLDDFLSPSMVEALLMRQLLEPGEFFAWLQAFAPQGFGALAEPPELTDPSDPKQSHLDGLCLSRAWCFERLGDAASAQRLLAAGLPRALDGDYVGTHWLASFAALAMGERP
jgi:hypothetical protein